MVVDDGDGAFVGEGGFDDGPVPPPPCCPPSGTLEPVDEVPGPPPGVLGSGMLVRLVQMTCRVDWEERGGSGSHRIYAVAPIAGCSNMIENRPPATVTGDLLRRRPPRSSSLGKLTVSPLFLSVTLAVAAQTMYAEANYNNSRHTADRGVVRTRLMNPTLLRSSPPGGIAVLWPQCRDRHLDDRVQ